MQSRERKMKLNKNRREVKIPISGYDLEGPVATLEARVRALIGIECDDPELVHDGWEPNDYYIVGTRAATPKEIERAKKASERSKHANAMKKAKKEEQERLEYERLRKKFENEGA
jgi:hypothetical protein